MSLEILELLIRDIEKTTDISLLLANNSEAELAKALQGYNKDGVK